MISQSEFCPPMENQESPPSIIGYSSEQVLQNIKTLPVQGASSPVLHPSEEELMEEELALTATGPSQQQFVQEESCLRFSLRTSPLAQEQMSVSSMSARQIPRSSPTSICPPVSQPLPPLTCASSSSLGIADTVTSGSEIPEYSNSIMSVSCPGQTNQGPPTTQAYKPLYNHSSDNGIVVTLEGRELWDEFFKRGTEMIVNRAGRRMFPGFAVNISGLKPKYKYTMKMEVVLADKHRFKFLNCQWIPIGTSDLQPPSTVYTHPDSPNSGGYWMRQGVSFRKVKITNNKDNPKGNVLLHSMHKYFVRLIVEEHKKGANNGGPPKTVLVREFPETTFITVTAYQNEEVTQLKISNNPFAKAFRDGSGQYDWDTLQMLYGPHSQFRNMEQTPGSVGNCPSMSSPLLPPMPMSHGLPHVPSPAWCATPHPQQHGYGQASPTYPHYPPPVFDWSSQSGQLSSPLANPPPVHPSSLPFVDHHTKMATSMFPAFQTQHHNDFVTPHHTLNNIPDKHDSWKETSH